MDSLIAAAARALAGGNALGALDRVALRHDPPALALRGIAMAQLGELARARELLRDAARGFGRHETRARARCVVAQAEVALALRDLGTPTRGLAQAAAVLAAAGEHGNAAQARLIEVRRALLLGRLHEADAGLAALHGLALPASLAAVAELAIAERAWRSLDVGTACAALDRAQAAAAHADVPALSAEVADAQATLKRPAARRRTPEGSQPLRLDDVAALRASNAWVLDACRRGVQRRDTWLPLARRPVLFALASALAEAWPGDADRDALIASAFRLRDADDTHRARLRVELGRLRTLLAPVARIEATPRGYALRPSSGDTVVVLLPPIDGDDAALLALLADGAAWSTSALALALGESQRNVQRALSTLAEQGRVRAVGRARAQRWLSPPLAEFATILLLPSSLPAD